MNKKYTYYLLIGVFVLMALFIIIRYDSKAKPIAFFPIVERKKGQETSAEWVSNKSIGDKLIRKVRENPDDTKSRIALATLYIQEARASGNHLYYDAAAMNYIDEVLVKDPSEFQALSLKAVLLLSQHHFSEALAVAQKAQASNPYNAFVYGLLIDAHVEMGHYEEAVKNADKMISIRPDIRSYSRISYLREITGDYPGAIEAMAMAVEAGPEGDEGTEWARIQLARLFEHTGKWELAEANYVVALKERPGYAYALAGLGNIARKKKDFKKAIELYQKADANVEDFSIKEQLAQALLLDGKKAEGQRLLNTVIEGMNKESQAREDGMMEGHYADKELAYAYIMSGDAEKALKHALAEYSRRPQNIDVNEAVAWAYYKKGDAKKALPYIKAALRTNSRNPSLLYRASLIYRQTDSLQLAENYGQLALKNDPALDYDLLN